MPIRVGIPRALAYYEYFPMWETFFHELGIEVVLSAPTTKVILNNGVKSCVDEACLPIKIFHGHVLDLKDRVDYLFIPRLKSVARNEYICPKFCGLPEMIKYSIKENLPPIIDVEINLRKNPKNLFKFFLMIGKFFADNHSQIKNAYEKAMQSHYEYKKKLESGYFPDEILEHKTKWKVHDGDLCIAVIGHVYNIYDHYVNMDIIRKFREQNIKVLTPEHIDSEAIERKANSLPKKMFWTFGKRLIGSVLHIIEQEKVDGIIYIMSFGCGIDAFISELCKIKVKRAGNIPFYLMTLDEHSGDAGLNTRLEAFIDMIRWRKQNESDISAYV